MSDQQFIAYQGAYYTRDLIVFTVKQSLSDIILSMLA